MSLLLNKNQVQDFMANSDKYNFRFYRKDKERIVAKDYDLVKDLILSEDRYSSKLPVSHNSPSGARIPSLIWRADCIACQVL